jgi:hypothetical protein
MKLLDNEHISFSELIYYLIPRVENNRIAIWRIAGTVRGSPEVKLKLNNIGGVPIPKQPSPNQTPKIYMR